MFLFLGSARPCVIVCELGTPSNQTGKSLISSNPPWLLAWHPLTGRKAGQKLNNQKKISPSAQAELLNRMLAIYVINTPTHLLST